MEGIELGFTYASIPVAVEVTEGRGTSRTMGPARSFHPFRAGAEFATGRGTLAITATATFRPTVRAVAIAAAIKLATGRRTLAITATATFGTTGRAVTFGAAVKLATGRGTLTETTFAMPFGTTLRTIGIGFRTKFATGRRTLAITTAFRPTGRAVAIAAAIKVATGRWALMVATATTFGTALRSVAFGATIKLATGRGALAVTTAFRPTGRRSLAITATFTTEFVGWSLPVATTFTTIIGPGEFRATIAAAVGTVFRPGAGGLLGNDDASETDESQRAEATGDKCRRPGSGC